VVRLRIDLTIVSVGRISSQSVCNGAFLAQLSTAFVLPLLMLLAFVGCVFGRASVRQRD
jgi:hypothetical protein